MSREVREVNTLATSQKGSGQKTLPKKEVNTLATSQKGSEGSEHTSHFPTSQKGSEVLSLLKERERVRGIEPLTSLSLSEREPKPKTEPTDLCFTHHAPHCSPPWIAIHRESVFALLAGYELTDAQKTDIGALMGGWCRLIDEAGLIHYGETEAEAATKACGVPT